MKARILFCTAAFLAACIPALASEDDTLSFRKSFSLEISSGVQPLHMMGSPALTEDLEMARKGMAFVNNSETFCVPFTLTEVWRVAPHWDLCISEGVCWKVIDVVQYDSFGVDPQGKPRYDLKKRSPAGRKSPFPTFTLYCQARLIWSPKWKVTVYSAVGAGLFSTLDSVIGVCPVPGITPVGLRYGGKHLYFFAEATLSPLATLGHGGLGWRF